MVSTKPRYVPFKLPVVFAFLAGVTVWVTGSPAQTFTTLLDFNGTNGAQPAKMALVQGTDGQLYGTTSAGGINGDGTVFKITATGALTTLHSFNSIEGASPAGGLIQGTDGNFYGTTSAGGTNNSCSSGCGTIFKITPLGTLTTLHSFTSIQGASPAGGLIQGTDGNFYGTTSAGGVFNLCSSGCGTIFKVTPQGTLTVLLNFDSTDGASPAGGLVQGSDGNFYGTASAGGTSSSCSSGCGTIFKITPQGALTVLQSFNSTDGSSPEGGLVQGSDGNYYGTTSAGGTSNACSSGCGTIFKVTPQGALTVLHSFDSTDGSSPEGGLIQGTDGNFYGTTSSKGANGDGTIFKITPGGGLTTLHSFAGSDGENPNAGLIQATDGNFYGATPSGGVNGDGAFFRLLVGLGPFVRTLPTSGTVGTAVIILGTDLTGATSVSFNGTAATFTVVSPSEITAIVPAGATTGKVRVTTPSGTLSSNIPFTPILSINPGGVVNDASYAAPVAPGSVAAVYGGFLLSSPSAAMSLPLPVNLSGLSMQFEGGSQAPLFYASGGQVNIQVPWELAGQTQSSLVVSVSGQTSAPQVVNLATFAPGIFSVNAQGTGQGAILDTSYKLVDTSNPATAGSTYIQIYGTGLGPVSNQPPSGSPATSSQLAETTTTPTVTIGNVPAQVLFSGLAPGFVGLYQVNAQVPAATPSGAAVPVVISIGDKTSNAVTIAVGP